MTCPDANVIAAFTRGELAGAARVEIETHLDGCDACDELVAELARIEVPGETLRSWLAGPRSDAVALCGRLFEAAIARHRGGEVVGSLSLERTVIGDPAITLGGDEVVAPEQLRGSPATRASDQFVVAAVAWELLTATPAHRGATAGAREIAMASVPEPPRDHRERARLAVLARALDPDPARRWATVDELRSRFERPIEATRRQRARWAVLAIASVAVIAWWLIRR